ncbi:hypothetical protein JCM5353_001526 [Sporobolomyces roseus]
MRTTTLLALLSSAALATCQSLASNAPGCATRCFTVKITEADSLAPGASTLNGYCQSSRFVSAYYTCLYDNCPSGDIPLSAQLLQQVCADQGAAVVTTGIVGPASTGISLSSIPVSSAASSASSAAGAASTGLSSISQSASSGISSVSSGISQTASSVSSGASSIASGASSIASGASSSASSALSGASQSATSVVSSAASEASSATSAAGGVLSSVRNGASSVLSVASGGVQSAVPSAPASGAGNLIAPAGLGFAGLLFAIFA